MEKKDSELKNQVISGLIWKFSERAGVQVFNFVVSIILARMLAPEDFGLISLVTVFIALADVFVNSGFGNALVQKAGADDLDFSSVFYFSIVASVIFYIVVYLCAPAIAHFFENELLTTITRAMGIRLLTAGINSVQNAYVQRNMLFRKYFFVTLGGTLSSSAIALIMAFNGYGVWALVAQSVGGSIINLLLLWLIVRWRPQLIFSWQRMKGLFSYGWKLLLGSIITTAYNELRSLVIGKMYSAADLAYYTKGRSFPHLIVNNIEVTIASVLFPAITKKQNDMDQVRTMTRRSIRTSAYLIIPAMTGLAIVARPLVVLLLTERWLESVPYLQISSFVCALMPMQSANLQAIKAIGRSDIALKLEIIKRSLGLVVLFLVMNHGVMAIALSTILTSSIISIINAAPNSRLLNYKYSQQLQDIAPFVGMSAVMAVVVYPINWLPLPEIAILSIQCLLGAAIYLGESILFKVESFTYIKNIIKGFIGKRKKAS